MRQFVLVFVSLCLIGCSRDSDEVKRLNDEIAKLKEQAKQQQLAKEAAALQATDIEGTVFVATRGGEVFKLALVPVEAVGPEAFAKQIREQRESVLAKVNDTLAPIKETAKRAGVLGAAYQEKLTKYNGAVSEFNRAGEELSSMAAISRDDRTITLNAGTGSLAKDRAVAFNIARKGLSEAGSGLTEAYADLDECYKTDAKERMQYAMTLALASSQIVPLDALPAIASSKTDGDGRFTISVKRPANVVLMAHSERDTPNGSESYWWYVPVVGKLEDSVIKLMLSNDNLVSQLPLLTPNDIVVPENLDHIPAPSPIQDDGVAYQVVEAPTPTPIGRADGSFDLSDLDTRPMPKLQSHPEYPFEMRRAGISGEVLVDFLIDKNGDVLVARAVHSSQREFEASAVQAVKKWKFRPGFKNGHPVFTHMQVPIVFSLDAEQ